MLVCVEGMDGVGKSNVTKALANELDFKLVEKPINRLLNLDKEQSQQITEKIYSEPYTKKLQAMYYLLGFVSVIEESKKDNIIMDRGFVSTYYFSHSDENNYLYDTLIENVGKPDLIILLYASLQERLKRINLRNKNDSDLKKKRLYTDEYDKFFECIKKYNFNYILINNNNLNENETINITKKLLELYMNNKLDMKLVSDLFSIETKDKQENLSFYDINEYINHCNLSNKVLKLYRGETN